MKQNRFIPYGYTVRDGRTVIEHTEADIIKEIFEEYIKGASLKDIAENLTARKVPYTEKTNVWDKARIARIIDNAKYTGSDEYDAIIDEDTFETAVSTKISRQTNTAKKECDGIAIPKMLPSVLQTISAGGIARAGAGSAVAVVLMIPPILIFILSQSSVMETMSHSGLK